MSQKLPYYMAYPMPLAYDDEKTERRDYEYMKSLYPSMAKKVLPYVEEECDRMEYQCSMMYDEYPDRLQLRMMGNRIYDNVRKHEKTFYGDGYEEMFHEDKVEEQAIRFPGHQPRTERQDGRPSESGRPPYDDRPSRSGMPPYDDRPSRPGMPPYDDRPSRPGRPPYDDRPSRPGRPPQNRPSQGGGNQNWLRDLIEVMLYQEMYKRRCDNRRCKRKFY